MVQAKKDEREMFLLSTLGVGERDCSLYCRARKGSGYMIPPPGQGAGVF